MLMAKKLYLTSSYLQLELQKSGSCAHFPSEGSLPLQALIHSLLCFGKPG
jgi:hypothetical protein